jgi:hypothetical protein
MKTIDPEIESWLNLLGKNSKTVEMQVEWFHSAFDILERFEYKLEAGDNINLLVFMNNGARVIAELYDVFPVDIMPSLQLSNAMENWEIVFSARSPLYALSEALKWMHPVEEVKPEWP